MMTRAIYSNDGDSRMVAEHPCEDCRTIITIPKPLCAECFLKLIERVLDYLEPEESKAFETALAQAISKERTH